MSQQEKAVRGTIICLLPEMVSSLRKELYFFVPEVRFLKFISSLLFEFSVILKNIFQKLIAQTKYDELKSEIERLRDELARKSQISSTPLESNVISQEWESFEFVTKKKGASGPTRTECISYYAEKYAYL